MYTIYKSKCSGNQEIEIKSIKPIGLIEDEPEILIQIRDYDDGCADFVIINKNQAMDIINLLSTVFSIKENHVTRI